MQNNNWSDELIKMIGLSRDAALEYGLSEIPSLCFLIGILRSKGFAYNILSDYGLSSEASIKEMLKTDKPLTENGNRNTDQTPKEITISVEGGRLLRFAQMEARRMGDSEVKPQHMLLSILHDHNNEAKTYLTGYGITLEELERVVIAHLLTSIYKWHCRGHKEGHSRHHLEGCAKPLLLGATPRIFIVV